MSLHVYLLCHNEEVLLPHAVEHYTDDAAKVSMQYLAEQHAARPFSEASHRTPPSWPPTLVRVAKRLRRVPAGVQRRVRRIIG